MITIDDTTQSISDWALDYGIPVKLIRSRLRRGWSEERAVTEPMLTCRGERLPDDALVDEAPTAPKSRKPRNRVAHPVAPLPPLPPARTLRTFARPGVRHGPRDPKRITHNGVTLTVAEWATALGISPQAMHLRFKTKPLDEALTPPPAWRRWKSKA
ncbi:hypothetical protein PUR29_37035 [Methylobacterium ajmalii]|uniref:DNA-binding protein n=1 Tax=Methylobacterium ajmalii TaxID=2738439 RepID=A0ABV0A6P1_9HYPH